MRTIRADSGTAQVTRVVSLKPNITAIIAELGAAEKLVGITKFCIKPHHSAAVVADYTSIDIEAVIRLKPSVVFISPENTQEKQVSKLQELGVNVVLLKFRTVAELRGSILEIGRVLHLQDVAETLVTSMDQDLQAVRSAMATKYGQKNRTALVVQRRPLMVATEQTFLGDLFRAAGFINVFAKDKIGYPSFDDEVLIRKNPDLIIELVHEKDETPFVGHAVISLPIADFLPHAKSVHAMREWLESSP